MNEEIFQLMAHAEDLQKIADKRLEALEQNARSIKNSLSAATENLSSEAPKLILSEIREEVIKAVQEFKTELLVTKDSLETVSEKANAASNKLSRTGLLLGLFLVLVTALGSVIGYTVITKMSNNRIQELANLKTAIKAERETLNELKSQTWGLELVVYSDGKKAILLPKSLEFSHDGKTKDGQGAIVFK